jgi:DNA-binding protein HU-beta
MQYALKLFLKEVNFVNKAELIASVAEKAGLTKKDAEVAVGAMISSIEAALVEGEKVQLIGFGTFETRQRKARQGRNPRKPDEVIKIAAAKAPVFKAGKALKDAVNK